MVAGLAICFGYVIIFGAPYLPTRQPDIDAVFRELPKKSGTFYDLGCGDGKVLRAAARAGFKPIGYELNPILWLISWCRLRRYGGRVYWRSFWRADLSGADVVFVFLIDHFMARLARKAKSELKSGSWLVSYTFLLPAVKTTKHTRNTYFYKF